MAKCLGIPLGPPSHDDTFMYFYELRIHKRTRRLYIKKWGTCISNPKIRVQLRTFPLSQAHKYLIDRVPLVKYIQDSIPDLLEC